MPQEVTPSNLEFADQEPPDGASQEFFSLEGLHILAVDDDLGSLALLEWMLKDAGAEVVAVTSVREAIAALIESPGRYDALLADIGMPDEDGLALIRQVRAMAADAGGRIPAVAITAYVSERERQMSLDAGFQIHLTKPVDQTQLIRVVAGLTGRVRAD